MKVLFAIFLGLAIIGEIVGGLGALAEAKSVFQEIENDLLFGFGTLTAETLIAARAVARTIEEVEARKGKIRHHRVATGGAAVAVAPPD
jgi:hypothetical protein